MSALPAVDVSPDEIPSIRDKVTPAEWEARVNLAACYRLVDYYGMSDLAGTHISARVPDDDDAFLINPYGLFFDEITASSLIKVNMDGDVLSESPYRVNVAGFTIHSAVHIARHDVACVLHTHTRAGMAVSALKCGLLPLSQHSARFIDNIGYHDYEGLATNLDERERLVRDLGETNMAMILRNHGLLTCGRNIPEAFWLVYQLEIACRSQIDGMAGGAKFDEIAPAVQDHTSTMFKGRGTDAPDRNWPGHLRQLDRVDPGYRN